MHKRAPMLAQKASATAQPTLPLQPPRPRSLSPHTLVLPYEAALSQPRSVQLEVPPDVGGETGEGTGLVTGVGIGADTGIKTGAEAGTAKGLVAGAEEGAGAGLAVGTSAQQRAWLVEDSSASHVGSTFDLVEPGATQ